METISVKICYKGKNINIGKGIQNQNRIVDELQKRFPQISRFKHNLEFQYEQSATNLFEAYSNAQANSKKTIKVKVSESRDFERTVQIQLKGSQFNSEDILSMSMREESVIKTEQVENKAQLKEKENIDDEAKQISRRKLSLQQMNIQLEKNQQDQNKNMENILDQALKRSRKSSLSRRSSVERPIINQQKKFKQRSRSVSPLKSESKRSNKQGEPQNNKQQRSSSLSSLKSERSFTLQKPVKQDNQSKRTKSICGDRDQKDIQAKRQDNAQKQKSNNYIEIINQQSKSHIQEKRSVEVDLSEDCVKIKGIDYQSSKQHLSSQKDLNQKSQSSIKKNKQNEQIKQLKKEFNLKIQDLEIKYNDLNQKYISLLYQFKGLVNSLEKGEFSFKSSHKQEIIKQGYERIPHFQSFQNAESSIIRQVKVQIAEIQMKQQIKVGQVVEPKFTLKNTGNIRWPQHVFALQKQTMENIEIKSLNPGEELVVAFGEQKGQKQGKDIKKVYQLVYYNRKGEQTKFGRTFGVFIKVKNQKLPHIPFGQQPEAIFQLQITNLMNKNNIKGKSSKRVIEILNEMGVNKDNYKQSGDQFILDIIRSFQ